MSRVMHDSPIYPFLLLGLAFSDIAAADEASAVVRFTSGDRLAGAMESLAADQLVWKAPTLEKPAPFFLKDILDITLPVTPPVNTAEVETTLTLTNGDTVRGQLAAVTADAVGLDTWFAGRMTFNRLMIAEVKVGRKPAFVYSGPTGMDGWTQAGDQTAWSYSGLAFQSQSAAGSIARDKVLPDDCVIGFDVTWTGNAVGLNVIAFSDDPASVHPSSGYAFSFRQGFLSIQNLQTKTYVGNTATQGLLSNKKARIEIRASTTTGNIYLSINERLVDGWTDPDVGKGKFGHGLHFVSTAASLRISRIGITRWDGQVDGMTEARARLMQPNRFWMGRRSKAAEPEKLPEGRMELANGDSVEGEVIAVDEGIVTVKTPLAKVRIPVARFHTVALKNAELERCKRRKGDIRAWFADGSSMVLRLEALTEDTLTGSSQNFGTATFKLAAFTRLEFNIHDPNLDTLRESGGS